MINNGKYPSLQFICYHDPIHKSISNPATSTYSAHTLYACLGPANLLSLFSFPPPCWYDEEDGSVSFPLANLMG